MIPFARSLLKGPLKHSLARWLGIRGAILQANGLDIWYESFGEKDKPAILLLMGAGCQGIIWSKKFCEELAKHGFFVIRFDQRDTGFSSYCRYKKEPYTLEDMACDAVSLLEVLGIEKAHLVGISLGGAISQIICAKYPARILSVTLMATSFDFRPLVAVMEGLSHCESTLSSPAKAWFMWIEELKKIAWFSFKKKVEKHLDGWEILNGPEIPFERDYYRDLMQKSVLRQRSFFSFENHRLALLASLDLLLETKGRIRSPALIVQGMKDPLFSIDHGKALAASIPQSSLFLVSKMGHNFSPCFQDEILRRIADFAHSY